VTFVEAHRHTFGVAPLLAAIGEPVSTFYDRTSRVPSVRAVADAVVAERIEEIWQRSRRSYGAPRIHAMLAREGIRVGRKRVERLMRGLGIQGAHLHKHWKPPVPIGASPRHLTWSSGSSRPRRRTRYGSRT
jgi:putative transposase